MSIMAEQAHFSCSLLARGDPVAWCVLVRGILGPQKQHLGALDLTITDEGTWMDAPVTSTLLQTLLYIRSFQLLVVDIVILGDYQCLAAMCQVFKHSSVPNCRSCPR
jgi:hypothetical protein